MKFLYQLLQVFLAIGIVEPAFAIGYPTALPNQNLFEEINEDSIRLIPKSDWISAAVDGQSYYRSLETEDFYHGIGYWLQARTEFRPHNSFRLNIRSILYSGSISGGYTQPTGSYHLVSLYGQWPGTSVGGKLEGRAMDLGRQTIGQGLMIEEKEMAGVWFMWSRNGHSVRFLLEGTGGLLLGDDLVNWEVKLFDGYLGLGILAWTAGDQSSLLKNRAPLYYVSSAHSFGSSDFGYFLEAGSRHSKFGALFGLQNDSNFGRLSLRSKLQARHYEDGFADEFVGSIQHMYVSYDQYDKRFTNAANVFVRDDDVQVYSVILDLDYEFNQQWSANLRNEVGNFDYRQASDRQFHFYRVGMTYFPILDREESLTLFASNKVLTDSYSRPPQTNSFVNIPLFQQVGFFGFEAAFKF